MSKAKDWVLKNYPEARLHEAFVLVDGRGRDRFLIYVDNVLVARQSRESWAWAEARRTLETDPNA